MGLMSYGEKCERESERGDHEVCMHIQALASIVARAWEHGFRLSCAVMAMTKQAFPMPRPPFAPDSALAPTCWDIGKTRTTGAGRRTRKEKRMFFHKRSWIGKQSRHWRRVETSSHISIRERIVAPEVTSFEGPGIGIYFT